MKNNKVICVIYKNMYRNCCGTESTTQGGNCAASHVKRGQRHFLVCHYGSDFDTDCYEFVDGLEDSSIYIDADPICDSCIKKLIDDLILDKIPGEYPWGLYSFPDDIIDPDNAIPIEPPSVKRYLN